jgi:hypothetical protein
MTSAANIPLPRRRYYRHHSKLLAHYTCIQGHLKMKTLLSLCALFLALTFAGCNMLQKAEIIRKQNVRNAANKYATGNWLERREAVNEIIKYYGPEKNELIIGTLLVALSDPHEAVRIAALTDLARFKLEATHAVIKKIAAEEENTDTRWYALKALKIFRDPADIDAFIKGFQSDDWLIREESVKGFLVMDDESIRSRLMPQILSAINDSRESIAITTLRRLKTKDERLYKAIIDKFSKLTKFNYSLIEATLTALNGYRLDEKTRALTINLLVHPNIKIRLLALKVLKNEKILPKAKK